MKRMIKLRLASRSSGTQSERAFVSIEFVAGVALLLLPTALLVMTFPTWYERLDMAHVAAREAAREYVLTGSTTDAQSTVDQINANYNLKGGMELSSLTGDPTVRGAKITATIKTTIPSLEIPIFDFQAPSIDITTHHTENVDLYRSQNATTP